MPPVSVRRRFGDASQQDPIFAGDLSRLDKKEYLQRKLYVFAQEVSIIGVRHAFDMSVSCCRKQIWMLLVLLGFGLAMYQIADRISYYNSHPTGPGVNIVQPAWLRFPQVTFCNENFLRKSVSQDLGFADTIWKLTQFYRPPNQTKPDMSVFDTIPRTSSDWDDIWLNMSQPINQSLVENSITYDEQTLPNSVMTPTQTDMGGCFAFNIVGQNFTATKAGSQNGLTLLLYVNQDDYLGTNSAAAGYRVLLHDPSDVPMMFELGFHVGPGFFTSVAFFYGTSTQLPRPYSECEPDPDYRQTSCIYNCQSEYIIQKCGCKVPFMPAPANVASCPFGELFLCAFVAWFESTNASNGTSACNCPSQCSTTLYSYTISQAPRSELFESNVFEVYNATAHELNRNYVTLNIFYSTLTYNDISIGAAYTFMALLSDVGGALGLLLGATLLTVYEVAEFCYQLSFDMLQARKKRGDEKRDCTEKMRNDVKLVNQVHSVSPGKPVNRAHPVNTEKPANRVVAWDENTVLNHESVQGSLPN